MPRALPTRTGRSGQILITRHGCYLRRLTLAVQGVCNRHLRSHAHAQPPQAGRHGLGDAVIGRLYRACYEEGENVSRKEARRSSPVSLHTSQGAPHGTHARVLCGGQRTRQGRGECVSHRHISAHLGTSRHISAHLGTSRAGGRRRGAGGGRAQRRRVRPVGQGDGRARRRARQCEIRRDVAEILAGI